jgi:hypothetical protein
MSNLVTCPTCKKPVSSSAEKCPHCGHNYVVPLTFEDNLQAFGCLFGLALALFIIFAAIFWFVKQL